MRGRAVPTTVWSSEARNIVSRTAPMMASFARGGSDIIDGPELAAGAVTSVSVVAKLVLALRSREQVFRHPRDDFDAGVARDPRAVEHDVIVARVLPRACAGIEMGDVSPPGLVDVLLLFRGGRVVKPVVDHRCAAPGLHLSVQPHVENIESTSEDENSSSTQDHGPAFVSQLPHCDLSLGDIRRDAELFGGDRDADEQTAEVEGAVQQPA